MKAPNFIPALVRRHARAFWDVLSVVLPLRVRSGRRLVMFSKYSGMGDIICTFPAVLELKKRHPQTAFVYNCHPAYACLPRLAGITDCVTHIQHPEFLQHWYGWLFAGFYQFSCADERADDCCKGYVVMEYARDHQVAVPAAHPRLEITPAVQSRIQEKLQAHRRPGSPLVIIQTGPTWPIREWPLPAWVELVTALQTESGATVMQLGTDHHLAMGTSKTPSLPGVVSLVNQLTLEESAAVLQAGDLFVGIDSGLLHLAAAFQIPCVGIFGPTSPHLRVPAGDVPNCVVSRVECQGCHHRVPRIHWETGCPYDARCMQTIPVAEVLSTCQRLLQRPVS